MNMKSLGQRLSTTASNNKLQKSMMVVNQQPGLEQSFQQHNMQMVNQSYQMRKTNESLLQKAKKQQKSADF